MKTRRNSLTSLIRERKCLVLDGALGTLLADRGESLNPILWSAGHLLSNSSCHRLRDIHREYYLTGADIVTSASYQISFEGFERLADDDNETTTTTTSTKSEAIEAIHRSIQLIHEAVASIAVGESAQTNEKSAKRRRLLVAGSIGCYGAHLCNGSEYHGKYNLPIVHHTTASCTTGTATASTITASSSSSSCEEECVDYLCEWHREKFHHLLQSPQGTDIIAFETIPCLTEVKGILKLLHSEPPPPISNENVAIWISIACSSESQLNSGESIEEFCHLIEDTTTSSWWTHPDRLLVGVNCTNPDYVETILQTMRASCHKDRFLVAYPNRGDCWDDIHHCYIEPTHDVESQFATLAVKWYEAGARVIGGCCKTNPSLIHVMANVLHEHIK